MFHLKQAELRQVKLPFLPPFGPDAQAQRSFVTCPWEMQVWMNPIQDVIWSRATPEIPELILHGLYNHLSI